MTSKKDLYMFRRESLHPKYFWCQLSLQLWDLYTVQLAIWSCLRLRAWLFLKTDEASDPSLKKFILWLRSRQKEEERCSSIKSHPRSMTLFGQRWAVSGDKPVEQVLWCAQLQASTTEIASSPHFPTTRFIPALLFLSDTFYQAICFLRWNLGIFWFLTWDLKDGLTEAVGRL